MTAAAGRPQFGRTMRLASLALGYPDEQWWRGLPLMNIAAGSLCGPPGTAMRKFACAMTALGQGAAQRAYVDTFDLHRRCCLYLTYYSCGDTRKRGMALLQFTAAYRAAGFELATTELPDHLAVLCEFAAAAPERGRELFRWHRAGVELLRTALADAQAPWLHVVDAVRGILPEAAPRDLQRALELARTGPPAEDVGTEPLGAVRRVAVHPPGACLQRTARLPDQALHRLPLAWRTHPGPPRQARLGTGPAPGRRVTRGRPAGRQS